LCVAKVCTLVGHIRNYRSRWFYRTVLRRTRHEKYLPAMIEGLFEPKASSPANATGGGNRFTLRCSNADRHKDDVRPSRFMEPLNDTTGRTKRVFRKTPPPPLNRQQSMPAIGSEDIVCASARLDRFEEPPQRHDWSPEARAPQDTATIEDQVPVRGTLSSGWPSEDVDAEIHDFEDCIWIKDD